MNEKQRKEVLDTSWHLHSIVESEYLNHSAVSGDEDWQEKQRLLLADMALHLLQTATNDGEIKLDKLTNNLYSILTISDQFIEQANLKETADKLYPSPN